jgi:hypothetical protein
MTHFYRLHYSFTLLLTFIFAQPSMVRAEACHEVALAGVNIICIETGVGSFSASDRANAIQHKIEKLSQEQTFDPDQITVQDQETTSEIVAGDTVIASLRTVDLGKSTVKDPHALADLVANNIRLAIKEDRHLRSPKEFMQGALYAIALSLALALLLFLLSLAYRYLYALIRRGEGGFIPSFRFHSYELLT